VLSQAAGGGLISRPRSWSHFRGGLADQGKVPLELAQRVDAVSDRFEAAWRSGPPPRIEDFLPDWEASERLVLLRELLLLELYHLARSGQTPSSDAYGARFPELNPSWLATALDRLPTASAERAMATQVWEAPQSTAAPAGPAQLPQQIGRYRVENILGGGGFGVVYLAHDDQLERPVSIKVPHPQRIFTPQVAQVYLTEARAVAKLDHPHIVPVFDVGSTAEFPAESSLRISRSRDVIVEGIARGCYSISTST
jgi:hypothetical protein